MSKNLWMIAKLHQIAISKLNANIYNINLVTQIENPAHQKKFP
jgi:hypothetical protein